LTEVEAGQIAAGLAASVGEIESGKFEHYESDEDVHTAVERRLTELAGPVGGKLHTGRSRNDQVATDFRLWMMQMPSSKYRAGSCWFSQLWSSGQNAIWNLGPRLYPSAAGAAHPLSFLDGSFLAPTARLPAFSLSYMSGLPVCRWVLAPWPGLHLQLTGS
jgi:hypothetical protein